MFHDLDTTLKGILGDAKVPADLGGALSSFLTPEKGYAPSENTVNLFLYDVKENRDLRDPVPIVERKNAAFVQRRPPLRVDCSYLVTAWSTEEKDVKVKEEHQLLGAAFLWLSRFPTIPDKFLQGTLANQPFPPPTMVAQLDGTRNTAEFWTALGIPPRPCFNLVVTIAMDLAVEVPAGPPVVSEEIRLNDEKTFQIGGVVKDDAGNVLTDARVILVETGLSATTDRAGRFRFGYLVTGDYKLCAAKEGYASSPQKAVAVPATGLDAYDITLQPAP